MAGAPTPGITARDLAKHYRVAVRPPGLGAALRAVFRREYRTVKAVDGVTFTVEPGERVGFLGPNGAGKTTTLKMLAGLLHPTAGEARVGGHDPRRRARDFLQTITLVAGQKQQLLWDLPPAETFELNRALYDVPRAEYRATLDELVSLLGLEDLIWKPTRQLSLGERMKCELAAALLHRPRVLFLDEPTIGLDVTMQAGVRTFLRAYNQRHGATVLLTSHYMEDVLALCPRILVIDRGVITYDGPLAELVRRARPDKRVTLRLGRPVARADLDALGARVVSLSDAEAVIQAHGEAMTRVVAAALAALPVVDLRVEDPPLEEVLSELFTRHTAAPPGDP